MINMRIEEKEAFRVAGQKTWISGQGNQQFGDFWASSKESGLIKTLNSLSGYQPGSVTKSHVFGIFRVEEDPLNRAFNFWIATEAGSATIPEGLETYWVPACKWAIFSNTGELPMSLVEAEMFAFMEWLPSSPYQHANAPELEVYPAQDENLVEFWLPVLEK